MSGYTTLVSAYPFYTTRGAPGFSAQQARLAMLGNARPGLFDRGDFAVTQRNAGANMSVDIAAGRAFCTPAGTHQGAYMAHSTATYNTSSDGGYTWTAADPTNPRIDLLGIEIGDTGFGSSYDGWKFRVIDGTPSSSATHQLQVAQWPAIPANFMPLAAIRIPATDTTISTTDITNLNIIGGSQQSAVNYIATAESTSGTAMGRLVNTNGTADFAMLYVPSVNSVVELGYRALVKVNVAAGNHDFAVFVNGVQMQIPILRAAPTNHVARFTLGTTYSQIGTTTASAATATTGLFTTTADSTTDETFPTTPSYFAGAQSTTAASTSAGIPISDFTAAGFQLFEIRYQASANTITAKNRATYARLVA